MRSADRKGVMPHGLITESVIAHAKSPVDLPVLIPNPEIPNHADQYTARPNWAASRIGKTVDCIQLPTPMALRAASLAAGGCDNPTM
jgi:hypothetical protein